MSNENCTNWAGQHSSIEVENGKSPDNPDDTISKLDITDLFEKAIRFISEEEWFTSALSDPKSPFYLHTIEPTRICHTPHASQLIALLGIRREIASQLNSSGSYSISGNEHYPDTPYRANGYSSVKHVTVNPMQSDGDKSEYPIPITQETLALYHLLSINRQNLEVLLSCDGLTVRRIDSDTQVYTQHANGSVGDARHTSSATESISIMG